MSLMLLLVLSTSFQEPGSKPTSAPIVLGDYEWVRGWGAMPDGKEYGNTHGGIVVTKKGEVLVNTDTERAIVVLTKEGRFVRSFAKEFQGGLHGMTLIEEEGQEKLWLAHTGRHCAAKVTLEGKIEALLPWPKESGVYESEGQYAPTSVAVTPSGEIFVADGYGRSWVHAYDKAGKYLRSFGGRGKEPGKFNTPHGVWIDTRGKQWELLVADRENHRIQRFDPAGKLLGVVEGMLRRPCGMHQHGTTLVVADLAGRVTLLDAKNELLAQLGDQPDEKLRASNGVPRAKWKDGEFLAPHSARFDDEGNLYVMDWNSTGRVTKLRRR